MKFIPLLIQRLKSDQPEFYKKLQMIAIYALIAIGAVYGILWIGLFNIPAPVHDKINTACYALGTFLSGIVFTSSTSTTNPELMSKDTKQAVIDDANNKTNNN